MPNKPVPELLLQLLLRGYHLEYDRLLARKLHNIGKHLSTSRRGGSNTSRQQLNRRNSHSLPRPGNNDHAQQWERGNQSHSLRIRLRPSDTRIRLSRTSLDHLRRHVSRIQLQRSERNIHLHLRRSSSTAWNSSSQSISPVLGSESLRHVHRHPDN